MWLNIMMPHFNRLLLHLTAPADDLRGVMGVEAQQSAVSASVA
jgi:hypothetical protein